MHIFDTYSNSIAKGVNVNFLYDPLSINDGKPHSLVSQILAANQNQTSFQAIEYALVLCLICPFWHIFLVLIFLSYESPASSSHGHISVPLQTLQSSSSFFTKKILVSLV